MAEKYANPARASVGWVGREAWPSAPKMRLRHAADLGEGTVSLTNTLNNTKMEPTHKTLGNTSNFFNVEEKNSALGQST